MGHGDEKGTRASAALTAKFATRHGYQKDCAARTGIAQSRLSRIASGQIMPRADEAARLEAEEGIPASWWGESGTPTQDAKGAA
jgi:transcriptional regulator with XRE-family HTH domain